MDKQQLIQGISNVLGWGDMLSHIAEPAIMQMINTHIARMAEVSEVMLTPEDCDYLLEWKDADLFGLLLPCPKISDWTHRKYQDFLSVREDIEDMMMLGFTHIVAIEDCYLSWVE